MFSDFSKKNIYCFQIKKLNVTKNKIHDPCSLYIADSPFHHHSTDVPPPSASSSSTLITIPLPQNFKPIFAEIKVVFAQMNSSKSSKLRFRRICSSSWSLKLLYVVSYSLICEFQILVCVFDLIYEFYVFDTFILIQLNLMLNF